MINLFWGVQRLFQAALAVPVGIAAMVIGQLGNEWMKTGDEEKKPAAAVKAPAAEKPAAPAKKAAAPAKKAAKK